MSELEEIARRLEAVEGLDWSTVERLSAEEYYGDWIRVGPVMIQTTDSPDLVDQADVAEAEAAAEFLRHAADDIRRLLAIVQER